MSSSRALCCFASVKKQKHDFNFSFRSRYNKTIIRFGFCDIHNNQGLGKGYQPQPSFAAANPYIDLDYSGHHKNLIQWLFKISFFRLHHPIWPAGPQPFSRMNVNRQYVIFYTLCPVSELTILPQTVNPWNPDIPLLFHFNMKDRTKGQI